MRALAALVVLAQLLVSPARARVIYVSPTGQDGNSCGLVKASPCGSLQYALATIAQSNDEVELASGTYVENGATIVFGTALQNLVIRSASGQPADVTIDRGYKGRLLDFTDTASEWFVSFVGIRFYRGGWDDPTPSDDYSGALMRLAAETAQISFTNCVFEGNLNPKSGFAGRGGVGTITAGSPYFSKCSFRDNWGGIAGTFYIANTASPRFDDCVFENSGCHINGWGGVVVPEDQSNGAWTRCVFRNNTCNYGGAVDDGGTATPHFVDCTFENNFGRNMGGAYYGFGGSSTKFDNCRFVGNRISKGGNGQDFYLSSSASPVFTDCIFDAGPDPVAVSDGASGTIKDNAVLNMKRCTVKGYEASYGTVHLSVKASGTIESSLFINNKCVRGGAIATERALVVRNTTFRNNEANEGGAISVYGMLKTVQLIRIEDSVFEDNTAKTSGGAIRATGPVRIELVRSRLTRNLATGKGGGALYSGPDAEIEIHESVFVENSSPAGGAIWSAGASLIATDSSFQRNALATKDENADDSCGLADGRMGGAIYVTHGTDNSTTASTTSCTMDDLKLERLKFESNAASDGGGGAIFMDGQLPVCIVRVAQACLDCVFTGNVASYGENIATAVNGLELDAPETIPSKWTLMTPKEIVLGATDRFGQRLAGSHAPLLVRISVLDTSDENSPVRLVSNTSRILRSGVATFKSVSLQIPSSFVSNKADRTINMTFTSDRPGITGKAIALAIPITLLKCPQSNGLLNLDGGCLVEATDSKQELVAGIIVAAVSGLAFSFVVYWSYKNSNRVLETIHSFVTGIGGVVVRFAFEIVDVVSDVQALVNLFLYDLTIAHPTLIRSAYLSLFVLSVYPAVAVLRWSVYSIRAQWKRVLARKAIIAASGNRTRSRRLSLGFTARKMSTSPEIKELKGAQEPQPTKWSPVGMLRAMQTSRKLQVHASDKISSIAIAPTPPALAPRVDAVPSNHYDLAATSRHLDEQEKLLLVELEYQHVRTNYMKRSLARLLSEDGLLLLFNVYIYLANRNAESFAKSRFRASLELSILLSVLHFGSQVQNITTWLQANKIAEIADQLEKIRALRVSAADAAAAKATTMDTSTKVLEL